jgi:hypothetical protein
MVPSEMTLKPTWDIYKQQPLLLKIVDGRNYISFTVAAVSKKPKGIVWWNLDYIITIQRGGGLGSGFCDNPIDKKPFFDFEREIWVIQREERTYEFHLPDRDLLEYFEKNRNYVSSLGKYQKDTRRSYGAVPKTKKWDLYSQQPLLLKFVYGNNFQPFTVAAVCKQPRGIVWWCPDNIDPYQKGVSVGFDLKDHPIFKMPIFVPERNIWIIQGIEHSYEFHLPDRILLESFRNMDDSVFISLEDYQAKTERSYGSTITTEKWDIYNQQPLLLQHPALEPTNNEVFVAGVTKYKKGVIWWSAGYLIGQSMTGQGGSGFAENPIPKRPRYLKYENCWIIERVMDNGKDWIYKFYLPTGEMLYDFEKFKEHIPTIEALKGYTKDWEKAWE